MAVFKESWSFSRQKLELLYSLFLLLVIPLFIAANTLFTVRSMRSNLDTELRKKANLANQVLGEAVVNSIDSALADDGVAMANNPLQRTVESIADSQPEIENLAIVAKSGSDYVLVAASGQDLDSDVDSLRSSLAIEQRQSIAQLVSSSVNAAERVWRVTSPIVRGDEVVAVTEMSVSLQAADELIANTLKRSFVFLALTLVGTTLLLANHFKFVQYAHLFRKLKEVDQLKNDFLNVATHELKAPMAVIEGGLSNVIDGLLGTIPDKAKDHLVDTRNQTTRLSALVEDLLNVSRIEQGQMSFKIERVNPQEIIKLIVGRYQDTAKRKGMDLIYDPSNCRYVNVDADKLQEIMTNLVDNAIKYSDEGTVTVAHRLDSNYLLISVKDSGVGMSQDEQKKLFRRFYRAQNQQTQDRPGTGLGLWIIKQYIEKMGGQIRVNSMAGVGTEFIVLLPLAEQG